MNLLAFIAAIVAIICFGADWARTKSLIALGLAFLTVSWIVQLVWLTGSRILVD